MVHLKTQQAISACLFKIGIKNKDNLAKKIKTVKRYTEICKVILVYYPKDRKLEHVQAIAVALSTNDYHMAFYECLDFGALLILVACQGPDYPGQSAGLLRVD
ncbi:hypothetical protein DSO57_1010744 [Entomophthora muscae]|uniref:Uncharacterized protein n=1 Tax=Entomophthora muscae TaxID=34485 RepID=A0ACC2SVN3_9FUNG|nr:hypothetical protein DSO57_1010744 [Entomophthora muscae]